LVLASKINNLSDLGSIASIIGLAISLITLIIAYILNKKVKKLQYSNLFDRTITKRLTGIDKLQKNLNRLLPDISKNEIEIKEILVELLAIYEALSPKLPDRKARNKAKLLIRRIKQSKECTFYNLKDKNLSIWDKIASFFKLIFLKKTSNLRIQQIYIATNENYNRIEQIRLDKKERIK
jgi:hypothetical protein